MYFFFIAVYIQPYPMFNVGVFAPIHESSLKNFLAINYEMNIQTTKERKLLGEVSKIPTAILRKPLI